MIDIFWMVVGWIDVFMYYFSRIFMGGLILMIFICLIAMTDHMTRPLK